MAGTIERVRAMLAVFAMCCLSCGIGAARAATPYQATVTNTACPGTRVCSFVFPPPSGVLTVRHISCSLVTTANQVVDGWVRYIRLTTTSAGAPFVMVEPGGSSYSGKSWISTTGRDVLYFVPARIAPKIVVITDSDLVAPRAGIDQPVCFVSGTTEP